MVLDKKLRSSVVLLFFSRNTEVPDAMEIIFQSALTLGRKGVVHAFIAPKVIDGKNTPSHSSWELGMGEMTQALELIDVCYEQIFDGHGGPEAAAHVRKIVLRLLFTDANFPETSEVDDAFLEGVESSLSKGFLLANDCNISSSCVGKEEDESVVEKSIDGIVTNYELTKQCIETNFNSYSPRIVNVASFFGTMTLNYEYYECAQVDI